MYTITYNKKNVLQLIQNFWGDRITLFDTFSLLFQMEKKSDAIISYSVGISRVKLLL